MFYLDQFRAVASQPQKTLTLSQSTIDLCLTALIAAENRDNWVQDLQPLDDVEWLEAEKTFLRIAQEELSA